MTIYHYDGTFEGLMTTLAVIGERKEPPADIKGTLTEQSGLFDKVTGVPTDMEKFGRFLCRIEREISRFSLRNAYHAFLAETSGVEMAIYRYLTLGWRERSRLDSRLADERVLQVHNAARKVRGEAYRMKGFVRFREVRDGFYYAPLAPDFRILSLIAPHFAARFSDQNWAIHDTGRGEGIIHDASRHEWIITGTAPAQVREYTDRELLFSELWRHYFRETAIAERWNPALQRSRLPLKHRRYLVETWPCRPAADAGGRNSPGSGPTGGFSP